jgi:hypothetical protein
MYSMLAPKKGVCARLTMSTEDELPRVSMMLLTTRRATREILRRMEGHFP